MRKIECFYGVLQLSQMGVQMISSRIISVLLLPLIVSFYSNRASSEVPDFWEVISAGEKNIQLTSENDSYLSTDNNYTNGIRVSLKSNYASVITDGPSVSELGAEKYYRTSATVHLANNMYTGKDITVPIERISEDDRPYAGWTYVGASQEKVYSDETIRRWEFDIGCLGPCAQSEQLQKWWHEHVADAPEPQGWDSQIENAVAIQYFYDYQFSKPIAFHSESNEQRWFDIAPSAHFEAGTVFNAVAVSGVARVGLLQSYFDGIGIRGVNPKSFSARNAMESSPSVEELFFYVRSKIRLVFTNATIEGALFYDHSPFTQDIRHGVVEFEAGIAFDIWRFTGDIFVASRSTEVESQSFSLDSHKWAGISLTFSL